MVEEDDEALARAAEVATGLALERFHALMSGRDTSGALPVSALIEGLEAPRHVPGELVQQYRIVRELGAGGMGTVFLAERADGHFRRQVAIKFLRGFPTEEGKRRLRGEREVLAELDHPYVARLLDGGETADGQPFLVLEYVEGETLHQAVASRHLDLGARVGLVERIGAAVAHAHQRLVVHRDLKPSNVLVTREGTPRLLDFGVARLLSELGDERSTRIFTPGYGSPEQVSGGRVTTRSDVYALGVMLHELVTGARLDGRPLEPPLPPVQADLDLQGIARKAAAEDPEERYPSADAFLDDLRRWRAGLPVRARPDTALYRLGRFARRHRAAVTVGVAVLLVVAGLGARLWRQTQRALAAEAAGALERTRTQAEAARARRLLEFVSQTFEAAAPDNARGKPLSASELLTDARRRLDQDPGGAQDRAELLLLLADLAGRIDDRKRALEFATEAVQALPPPTDRDLALRTASALEQRSYLLSSQGQLEMGLEDARRAEALVQRFAADDAVARDEAELYRGLALSSAADPAAWPLLERVADGKSTANQLERRMQASRSMGSLATHLHQPERALEAARRFRELAQRFPEGHPWRVDALYVEAVAQLEAGNARQALPLAQQALDRYQALYGTSGGKLADMYGALATIHEALDQFREAAAANDRGLELLREAGETGNTLLVSEANTAAMLETSGDYRRSEALLRGILARPQGDTPAYREQFESNLARTLSLEGRHQEARAMLLRVREQARAGGREATAVLAGFRLAQNALLAGQLPEARREIDAVAEPFLHDQPRRRWYYRRMEGAIRAAEGQKAEALAVFRELEREGEALFGPQTLDVAQDRLEMAKVLADLGQSEEARRTLAAALPVFRRAVLPAQRARAEAEALAARLGVR
jgi:eukaryotic-like serine/threonine-protein kinase